MMFNARFTALALACVATAALSQPVYRNVDANGKVTYSDQPRSASAEPARGGAVTSLPAPSAGLPFELQQVAQRYPVTLYTRDDCEPCSTAKSMLTTRGVPFAERTVNTPQDADALQRLSGQNSLPLLTIGSQQLKGYSDSEWTQYLDAAGYPSSSRLPAGYRQAPAAPLVAVQAAPARQQANSAPAAAAPAAPAPAPSGPTPSNPAGIKF